MDSRDFSARSKQGFAIIASLSIMALLLLIMMALFSLSLVATKTADIAAAQTEARSNARMALMLAIGDLQKYTGADTRVTAPADLINENAPPLTGAWKSWEGLNHDPFNGRPIAPDYSIKEITDSSPDARFLTWLVSGEKIDPGGNRVSPFNLIFGQAQPDGSTIPLLAEGSLAATDISQGRAVHLVPTKAENKTRYAWWVSPENQKARLQQPYAARTGDPSSLVELGQSHSVPNTAVFGLEALAASPEPFNVTAETGGLAGRVLNRDSLPLIAPGNPVEPEKKFHDFSTSAAGLLTNTATGGWRKDLSILTENWDAIYASYPGGQLPLFRYSPVAGDTSAVPQPTPDNYDPPQVSLYPWSEYSTIIGDEKLPATHFAASASWSSLRSFATAYKNFSYDDGIARSPFIWDKIINWSGTSTGQMFYDYQHEQRLYTQIARFQLLIFARIPPEIENPTGSNIRLKYVPVFTLWNPYNVALDLTISGTLGAGQGSGKEVNFRGFGWRRSLPGAMAIVPQRSYVSPEAVPDSQYRLLTGGNFQTLDRPRKNNVNPYDYALVGNETKYGSKKYWIEGRARSFGCWLPEGTISFEPGEAKVFSPELVNYAYQYSTSMLLKEGYDAPNVAGLEFDAGGLSHIKAEDTVWFLLRPDRLTQPYLDREPGLGFSLSFGDGADHFGGGSPYPSGIGSEFHNITALANEIEGMNYWPADEVDEVPYSMAELQSGPWFPLFSINFGPRMTIGTGIGREQNRPTKGVVQNNALASMVLSDPVSGQVKDHPVNNTFDFAYESLTFNGNTTPNSSDSEGYIVTGYQSGDGLSRFITHELPLRPMASLIELQSWNPRGDNPYPPFQMNLIGNSDATPLIPQDNVVPAVLSPSTPETNLMHDDAYCANHLLFDDWFVSSIGPKQQLLGGESAKDIETFYADYLRGSEQLSNRAYKRITEDFNLSPSEAVTAAGEILDRADGFLRVASRFIVDGMFNVNSTSVDAWKAVLGHAKNRAELALQNVDALASVAPKNPHPITRGATAFDAEAGEKSVFDDHFENATEITGFKSLTDAQIEDLAVKIVEQVRKRGPFLSLSEFINRQLSADGELALAGAVQTAINNLNQDPMQDLRDSNNSLSEPTMPADDPKLDGADYAFEAAAAGDSAYGAPGWIRQADVLRPLAPVLSARDDTFTIRAYGDKLNDRGKVIAQAWCEAVVRRSRHLCDTSEAADLPDTPIRPINLAFGRRYEIIDFRWLAPNEV